MVTDLVAFSCRARRRCRRRHGWPRSRACGRGGPRWCSVPLGGLPAICRRSNLAAPAGHPTGSSRSGAREATNGASNTPHGGVPGAGVRQRQAGVMEAVGLSVNVAHFPVRGAGLVVMSERILQPSPCERRVAEGLEAIGLAPPVVVPPGAGERPLVRASASGSSRCCAPGLFTCTVHLAAGSADPGTGEPSTAELLPLRVRLRSFLLDAFMAPAVFHLQAN